MEKLECKICGGKYVKLLTHVKKKHGVEGAEYREAFGLPRTGGLIPPEFKKALQDNISEETKKRIREIGKIYGFKKGVKNGAYKRTPAQLAELKERAKKMREIRLGRIKNKKHENN